MQEEENIRISCCQDILLANVENLPRQAGVRRLTKNGKKKDLVSLGESERYFVRNRQESSRVIHGMVHKD